MYRFGATIGYRAAATLIFLIEQKCKSQGETFIKVDTKAVKTSQFDHLTEEYTKHSLSTRIKFVGDDKVQCDLYSIFLLAYVEDDKKIVNVNACILNILTQELIWSFRSIKNHIVLKGFENSEVF